MTQVFLRCKHIMKGFFGKRILLSWFQHPYVFTFVSLTYLTMYTWEDTMYKLGTVY